MDFYHVSVISSTFSIADAHCNNQDISGSNTVAA